MTQEQERAREYLRRHGCFSVDEFNVCIKQVAIEETWFGWLEISRRNSEENNQQAINDAKAKIRRHRNSENFYVAPYNLDERGLVPDWLWIFQLRSLGMEDGGDIFYERFLTAGCFTDSLLVSPHDVVKEFIHLIDWKNQTTRYEYEY